MRERVDGVVRFDQAAGADAGPYAQLGAPLQDDGRQHELAPLDDVRADFGMAAAADLGVETYELGVVHSNPGVEDDVVADRGAARAVERREQRRARVVTGDGLRRRARRVLRREPPHVRPGEERDAHNVSVGNGRQAPVRQDGDEDQHATTDQ